MVSPEEFITDEFVAIFNEVVDINNSDGRKYVFESSLYFKHILNGLTKTYGWEKKMLLIPAPKGRCRLSSSHPKDFSRGRSNRCKHINIKGHHVRHMNSHLPKGVGFFTCCPGCGRVTPRGDMVRRHAMKCAPTRELDIEELIVDTKKNTFLRSVYV